MHSVRTHRLLLAALLGTTLAGSACSSSPEDTGPVTVEVWAHDGTDAERAVLEEQVAAFNERSDGVQVTLRLFPEGDYNDELQAAVARGDLPDAMEVDGPLLPGYVYQDVLVPLEDLLPAEVLDDQLPSLQAQGASDGHTWAVGTFDSGLGLYADRRALSAAGVRIPTSADDAWSAAEFSAALRALARTDRDGRVLDVKLNYGPGEWLTYGFAPLVASAGGALLDPASLSPEGHLDGPAARRALRTLQSWSSYIDPNAKDDAFVERRVALSWVGHWMYHDYARALGKDLAVLPLPDLGNGSKTGQGSWAWTVTSTDGPRQRAAAAFLAHLLEDEEVLRMTAANGAVPGDRSALATSDTYAEGGPLAIFADQLLRSCGAAAPTPDCVAVPRPATPGYAVLTSQFAHAVSVALAGKDPVPALVEAARFVGDDVAANDGFR